MASILLKELCLRYDIIGGDMRSLRLGLANRVRSLLGSPRGPRQHVRVQALENITLSFKDGDRVALIGRNGAGKSTLLMALAGIYEPQSGSISVGGRISSILNPQVGVDPTATGYENIYISGLLHGINRSELTAKIRDIAEFSELGDFLFMPVRTYSQGMRIRLAFSIATSIEPDILLMDEWIGAGDEQFIIKAKNRLENLIQKSSILVLASHNIGLVKLICNKAVFLDQGKVVYCGPVEETLMHYHNLKGSPANGRPTLQTP